MHPSTHHLVEEDKAILRDLDVAGARDQPAMDRHATFSGVRACVCKCGYVLCPDWQSHLVSVLRKTGIRWMGVFERESSACGWWLSHLHRSFRPEVCGKDTLKSDGCTNVELDCL